MSDRRSFSEIPQELLAEQGHDERVDRIWRRLEGELAAPPRRVPRGTWTVAIAAMTFGLGLVVGARGFVREASPPPLFAAEPEARSVPAAAAESRPSSAPAAVKQNRGESRPVKRGPGVHHAEAVVEAPAVDVPLPAPSPSADWRQLADDGQYAQALAALESSGGFDAALRDATAEQLMSLVDVARATGQRDRAIVALRRVVSEHGADPNAPVAAWMLGNELAKARDLASAEQAFAMYRALSPGGDFAEDALARQIDMAVEQGHVEHARKLAGQYLKEFPDGPRTAEIQAEVDAWSREAPAPSAEGVAHGPQALPDAGPVR